MQFDAPRPKRESENILPMINVVFLLLIFFLMSAQLAPPEPFAVELPVAAGEDAPDAELVIFVDASGEVGFRDALGKEAVLEVLAAELLLICGSCDTPEFTLKLRADGALAATDLAVLLPEFSLPGVHDIALMTAPE